MGARPGAPGAGHKRSGVSHPSGQRWRGTQLGGTRGAGPALTPRWGSEARSRGGLFWGPGEQPDPDRRPEGKPRGSRTGKQPPFWGPPLKRSPVPTALQGLPGAP